MANDFSYRVVRNKTQVIALFMTDRDATFFAALVTDPFAPYSGEAMMEVEELSPDGNWANILPQEF